MKYRTSIAVTLASTLMLLSSGNAHADQWGELHNFGDRKLFLRFPHPKYVDKPIRVWTLISYKNPQQTNRAVWQSWVHLEEFDCKGENTKSKEITFYPESMAMGQPVKVIHEDETSAIQPGTMGELVFQLVCQR